MTIWQYNDVSEDGLYWRRSTYWLKPPAIRRKKRDIVTFIVGTWDPSYMATSGSMRRRQYLLHRAAEMFYSKVHIVPLWSYRGEEGEIVGMAQLLHLESATDGEPSRKAMISAFKESHLVIASWGDLVGRRKSVPPKTMEFEELEERGGVFHLGLTHTGHPTTKPSAILRPERWVHPRGPTLS